MVLFIFDNICSESRGFSGGIFFLFFFCPFSFSQNNLCAQPGVSKSQGAATTATTTTTTTAGCFQFHLSENVADLQVWSGWSEDHRGWRRIHHNGAGNRFSPPPSAFRGGGSSQWEGLPSVLRPLEFIADSTRAMFSFSLQHSEHLGAWLSSDLQLLRRFFMHWQSIFFHHYCYFACTSAGWGKSRAAYEPRPGGCWEMTRRALHTFFSPSSSFAYCNNTAESRWHHSQWRGARAGPGDNPDAAFTSCTTRRGVKSVTNRRSAGRNYTRYGHFNAISSLRRRPKRSGHPTRVTLKNQFEAEAGGNLCLYTCPAYRDFGKAFECYIEY